MARVDDDIVGQRLQTLRHGLVELVAESLGRLVAKQVGPSDIANEEDVARVQRDGLLALRVRQQQEGDVLRGVTGRPDRLQAGAADVNHVAIVDRRVLVLHLAQSRCVDRSAGDAGELLAA